MLALHHYNIIIHLGVGRLKILFTKMYFNIYYVNLVIMPLIMYIKVLCLTL